MARDLSGPDLAHGRSPSKHGDIAKPLGENIGYPKRHESHATLHFFWEQPGTFVLQIFNCLGNGSSIPSSRKDCCAGGKLALPSSTAHSEMVGPWDYWIFCRHPGSGPVPSILQFIVPWESLMKTPITVRDTLKEKE